MTSCLYIRRKTVFPLFEVNLLDASDEQLEEANRELGIGLSPQETKAVRAFFKVKGRNPTDVELQTIGQTWSEHCFHKTFKGKVKLKGKEIDGLFKTYITRVTDEINPPWCFSVFEENAGIVEFTKEFGIAIKVETHNHPSAVEPFGGAATGTGGVIRDVLGVWAEPIACTDVLGFGPLDFDYSRLPSGVKHPKYVFMGVIAGIGAYGNNMGIPTVNGAICFDESYTGNVVVYCGCAGLLPLKKFKRSANPHDVFVLAGGRTGRDGIHGVTFASAELTEKSEELSRPSVQIANPFEEEKLKRAIIRIRDLELASSITDLGGGGLSSAVGETARKFGCGALIELDKVSLKYQGLAPWEVYISESQERMLLTVPAENLARVLGIFCEEDVEAVAIGELTGDEFLQVLYQGQQVAEVEIPFLFAPPKTVRTAIYRRPKVKEPFFARPSDLTAILFRLLSSPNVASRESVVRTYDHEVRGATVLKPFQGEFSGPNDAAVLKPLEDSWKGVLISCGINPKFGRVDPYWMAASAIDEAIRNNVAVGGRRIALLDNFTWGSPEKPERLGSLARACKACYDMAKVFRTPFISGKDSLYNESPLGPVTPTLLITALGIIPDVRNVVSMETKTKGNLIYIVGKTYRELGGSEYYRLDGFLGKSVPKVRAEHAKRNFRAITRAIDRGLVRACHDLAEGGLAVAAAEMAFSGGLGLELDLRKVPQESCGRDDFLLFSESNSRFLVEVSENAKTKFESLMKGRDCAKIGKVSGSQHLLIYGLDGKTAIDAHLEKLLSAWKQTLGGEI